MLPTRAARALFTLLVPAAVCAAACSSGTGALFANGGETGGESSTSTTGAGAGNGTGATSTTSSSGTTTTSSGATTTSSGSASGSSTSSSTSASSTTSSGASAGACTDAADTAKLAQLGANLQTDVTNCAKNNFGNATGINNCIAMLGLSAGCTTCFDNNVQCADQKCLTQCFANPSSAGCTSCIHTNCTPAFNTCSGIMGL